MIPVTISVVVGVVVALALVGVRVTLVRRRSGAVRPAARPLPQGADAALWSVVEVQGDPRNHLAGKDPTSELRITAEVRRLAGAGGRRPVPTRAAS